MCGARALRSSKQAAGVCLPLTVTDCSNTSVKHNTGQRSLQHLCRAQHRPDVNNTGQRSLQHLCRTQHRPDVNNTGQRSLQHLCRSQHRPDVNNTGQRSQHQYCHTQHRSEVTAAPVSHTAQVRGHSNASVTHTTQVRGYSSTSASKFKSRGHSNISFTHDTSQRSRQHLCLNKHRSEVTTTLLSHNTRSEVTAPLSHTTQVRGHNSTSVSIQRQRSQWDICHTQHSSDVTAAPLSHTHHKQRSQQHLCHTRITSRGHSSASATRRSQSRLAH